MLINTIILIELKWRLNDYKVPLITYTYLWRCPILMPPPKHSSDLVVRISLVRDENTLQGKLSNIKSVIFFVHMMCLFISSWRVCMMELLGILCVLGICIGSIFEILIICFYLFYYLHLIIRAQPSYMENIQGIICC